MEVMEVTKKKPDKERAVRRNISLPPELDRIADGVAKKFAYPNFSDYVQAMLRRHGGLEPS